MPKLECNIANMTRLVEALESGERQQARHQLRDGDRLCCLGVASDLAASDGIGRWKTSPFGGYRFTTHDRGSSCSSSSQVMLPEVIAWLGVRQPQLELRAGFDNYGSGNRLPEDSCASAMNDGNFDFRAIARRLREVYLAD
jgi:hypothetical protein